MIGFLRVYFFLTDYMYVFPLIVMPKISNAYLHQYLLHSTQTCFIIAIALNVYKAIIIPYSKENNVNYIMQVHQSSDYLTIRIDFSRIRNQLSVKSKHRERYLHKKSWHFRHVELKTFTVSMRLKFLCITYLLWERPSHQD